MNRGHSIYGRTCERRYSYIEICDLVSSSCICGIGCTSAKAYADPDGAYTAVIENEIVLDQDEVDTVVVKNEREKT